MPHIDTSLTPYTTFGLNVKAHLIAIVNSVNELSLAWQQAMKKNLPVLLLGAGSNVLFIEDFTGVVIVNRIKGISIMETEDSWHLHVGAGENWHQLVEYTLEQGIAGIENLALIPGCAGSAPIQNIGAYGVEFKSVCEYVDVLDLYKGISLRLRAEECQFGYRESVFKHHYRNGYAIIAVGIRLTKQWQPVLSYGDLTRLDPSQASPKQIFDTVCHMRATKLPDPKAIGNAGSFFKNPIVSVDVAKKIKDAFPDVPLYPQDHGHIKLAAGWLIDKCKLKGYQIGGAAVHHNQALVLTNQGGATGLDIVALAHHVRESVGKKFNVWLEPEVRFIAAQGEVSAVEVIS